MTVLPELEVVVAIALLLAARLCVRPTWPGWLLVALQPCQQLAKGTAYADQVVCVSGVVVCGSTASTLMCQSDVHCRVVADRLCLQ